MAQACTLTVSRESGAELRQLMPCPQHELAPTSTDAAAAQQPLQLSVALLQQLRPTASLRAVLAAVPGAATAADARGWRVLHWAALEGQADAVEALLQAAPSAASIRTQTEGFTALHIAAARGHVAVARLLLQAAPQLAGSADLHYSWTPAHWAALGGHAEVLKLLLDACPGTAMAPDKLLRNPLHVALASGRSAEALRCLLAAGPAASRLTTLLAAGLRALPRFADFVIARPPLTDAEWALVPVLCPGLGRALPAALAHSPAQAASLVAHLLAGDAQRLRTFALCLARAQRRHRVYLPSPIVAHLISMFDV